MSAERLFEELSPEVLAAFLQDGREEDLTLEFKLVGDPAFSNSEDRRNLAKALSGFANSDGGVVLWGCDSRQRPDGGDGLQAIPGVRAATEALARLQSLTGEAVRPLVDGVRHKLVELNGVCVLATFVPQSDSGPHMAKCKENRYYKRSGDSFYCMEHFDIADMFGRRPQPRLKVKFSLLPAGGSGREANGLVVVSIENSGRGVATAPSLCLLVAPPFAVSEYGLTGNMQEGLPRVPRAHGSREVVFAGNTSTVVHSRTELQVCAVKVSIQFTAEGGLRDLHDLKVKYAATCAEGSTDEGEYTLTVRDYAEAYLDGSRLAFVLEAIRLRRVP